MNAGQIIIIGIGVLSGAITLYLLWQNTKNKPHHEK
jgi:hypothetical protein